MIRPNWRDSWRCQWCGSPDPHIPAIESFACELQHAGEHHLRSTLEAMDTPHVDDVIAQTKALLAGR
jgi:hypothetical protein